MEEIKQAVLLLHVPMYIVYLLPVASLATNTYTRSQCALVFEYM